MQGARSDRIADLIKREIAEILSIKVRDPRIGFVTITSVGVSGDLRHANVSVSTQEGKDTKKTLAAIKKASPYIRGELAKRLSLRRMPALHFESDQSSKKASHLLCLLDEIGAEAQKKSVHQEETQDE